MANMRKDDNNVYIDLWGETLEFNKTEYALYQLSTAFEVRVANDIKTIVDKRIHGKAIENFKQVGNEVSFQFLPWIYDNIDYVKNTIKTSSALVKSILSQYDIDLTPNWNEINKKWIEQVEKIRQIYISAMNETVDALKRNDEIRYQQAYNEELSRDFGLGFGIISNSLVSHLLYAAQSASKEAKDHQRAAKYAYENSGETLEESTTKILHVVYPLYTDKMEPALTKLLSEYYAYVVSIFSKELNCSYDDVAITFDFNRSNAFILGVSDNAKANVLEALEAYPNNGNVIGYAIKNDILDDALCEYGNTAPSKFGIILKNWTISVLSEIYQAGKLFNKPYVTDENRTIIKGLISYYEYIDDHSDSTDNDWQDILDAVYGDEIIEFVDIFEIFEESQNSNVEIINYAKANKKVTISNDMLNKFIVACNELKDGSCYWYATTMGLNPDQTITAEQVRNSINDINAKIDAEIVALKEKSEQQRKAEEQRKEAERQAEIKRQEEKQKQRALLMRKTKKIAMIVTPITVAIIAFVIILNTVIIPSSKYNSAMQHLENGEYTEAYIILKELDNYKDCVEKCYEIEELYPQIPFRAANVGDIVNFGVYEQDGNTSNGKEKMKWIVLAVENDRVLVISANCIESMQFQETAENKTWETSSIRKWLNNSFYNTFTEKQKSYIETTYLQNETYVLNSDSGNNTYDNIFLLSVDEARLYFDSDDARCCSFSKHASQSTSDPFWWLRTKGEGYLAATFVTQTGKINPKGLSYVYHRYGIRPAMWIDITNE